MSQPVSIVPKEEHARRVSVLLQRQLGPLMAFVGAEGVTDLMLNPDGNVWVHQAGNGKRVVGRMTTGSAEAFIAAVASTVGVQVTRESPILECELPRGDPFLGARIEALMPPVVSAPSFAVRFRATSIYRLADYVERGIMTARQHEILRDAAVKRLNVVIAGGTGSGKTTALNAFIAECVDVTPDHRFLLIEDTAELQCLADDTITMRSTIEVSQQTLLKAAMRLAPDRPIVGEVRGGEALTLLKAWNTGHDGGASTVHATSARKVPLRLEQLIQEVSQAPQREHIAEALHLIVFIRKVNRAPGRLVEDILSIDGLDASGRYNFKSVE